VRVYVLAAGGCVIGAGYCLTAWASGYSGWCGLLFGGRAVANVVDRIRLSKAAKEVTQGDAPELLDIAITKRCTRRCPYCYMDAGDAVDMPLVAFEKLMEEAGRIGVFQVALGGGEPTIHPQFIDILACARQHKVVPNYTTNGDNLTNEVLEATAKYVGAAAISYHDGHRSIERGKPLTEVVPTNIHFILGHETVDEAIWLLQHREAWADYNAVIFLRYKPVGRADASGALTIEDAARFLAAVEETAGDLSGAIGFDACLVPLLFGGPFADFTYSACGAARFSMFVDVDGRAAPCSFFRDKAWPSAFEHGIRGCWHSKPFEEFRQSQERNGECAGCQFSKVCRKCLLLDDICGPRVRQCRVSSNA